MAKGRPLSAAHKAAISAGLKRYWAGKRSGGSGGSSRPTIINIDTGKAISREEAAIRMYGTAGAAKKLAAGKKVKKRR
jgi:hypothetical protein